MTVAEHLCPHKVNIFEASCGQCRREQEQYDKAVKAVEALGQGVNGGEARITAAALNTEHAYLFQKLAEAMAMSTLARTYDSLCPETGTIFGDTPHPAHDGRLACGTVIGACYTLAFRPGGEVLVDRRFWLGRVYDPGY